MRLATTLLLLYCTVGAAGQPGRVAYKVPTSGSSPVQASPLTALVPTAHQGLPSTPEDLSPAVLYATLEPDCTVNAVDATSGQLLWRYAVRRRDTADPADSRCGIRGSMRLSPDGSLVHLGTDNNTFVAVRTADGTLAWNYSAPSSLACLNRGKNTTCEVYATALLVPWPGHANATIRIQGSEDGHVRAFDAASGALVWDVDLGSEVDGTAVVNPVNGSEVIVGADDGQLYCLAIATGNRCGTFPSCGTMDSQPAVDPNASTLFFTCYIMTIDPGKRNTGAIYAVDAASGATQWKIVDAVGPPMFVNGVVYVGLANGSVVALDPATGTSRWRNDNLPHASEFFGVLVFDASRGLLYGGNLGGMVVALEAATGKVVWSVDAGGPIANNFGPALAPDGTMLWVGTYAGDLVAITLE
eukprot:m.202138 g.202138  ORF g.202138 m.202138 type:complete len:414 (-) comp21684_c0_seq1:353-1594(-)